MNETEQEVNVEKLLEWAGFRHTGKLWRYPVPYDGEWHYSTPDFPNDLNACFKWLVPKLTRMPYLSSITLNNIREGWHCMLLDLSNNPFIEKRVEAEAKTPALALCKAIEKLIGDKDV